MKPEITVAICTHKPRPDYLNRVLDSLRGQSLPLDRWEFFLIETPNASPDAPAFDLGWHPNGRRIEEAAVGLAYARRRAHLEARADIILYVDDDNVLPPDFLETGLRHLREDSRLGCCGPAILTGEFETAPTPEMLPYVNSVLAVFELPGDRSAADGTVMLPGAGMFCRRSLLAPYFTALMNDPRREFFGGKRGSMLGNEDTDLVWTIIDQGYAIAQFRDLHLIHLTPSWRLTEEYLLNLARGKGASTWYLGWARGARQRPPVSQLLRDWVHWLRLRRLPVHERKFSLALWRGQRDAYRAIREWERRPQNG